MGLFDNLFDKREKKSYLDIKHFFFDIAQIQRIQYPEQFVDVDAQEYRNAVVGIFAAYMDTKPKQKCVITSYGSDMFISQIGCVSREVKEKVLPKYKDAYKHYGTFIKNNMNGVLNASNVRILAEEVCRVTNTESTVERINSISMDINTMTAIIDATFDTYRFV